MRARARWILLGLLAALLLCVAWTGVALQQARTDLREAQSLLTAAADSASTDEAEPLLARAQDRLESAEQRLRAPGPAVVTRLPLAGRTVVAARDTAAAGAAVVRGARGVVTAVPEALLSGGRFDLVGLRAVEEAMREAAETSDGPVRRLDGLELRGTPGSLSEGVLAARAELSQVPSRLRAGADGLAALRGILGEDRERHLLIVLQNNAELRATGGLVSVFAEATARDGALELGRFAEVEDVADPPAEAKRVAAPDDYRALFEAYLAGTTLWKNVNMSADVPTSSQVIASVARASLPQAPDAVVWVDVRGIAAVLRATGPVTLPDGSTLSADNAVDRLLSQAYADAVDDDEGQNRRRGVLRAAADAVLAQLLAPGASVPAASLAREVAPSAAGRHVVLWSAQEDEQELLVSAGLAGSAAARGGDLTSFALHNLGDGTGFGNKLDYYGRRQVTVRVEVGLDEARVEQEVAVRNTAPAAGLPEYVSGRRDPGVLKALVTLGLPADARGVALVRDGTALVPSPQPLGDHRVQLDATRIPPGGTVTWRLTYRLPLENGRYTSRLIPQPLAVDAGLLLEVRPAQGLQLAGGPTELSGPFDAVTEVDAVAQRPSWSNRFRDRVRRFWNEPVELPG